jgi:phytol kinase
MMPNNIVALIAAFVLAVIWLRLNDYFAHKGWINSWLSRKVIHIGTGPIFIISWLLFKDTASARFLAALIPLSITLQFVLVGLGMINDPAAVKAMSRTGDRKEILRGPLFYGLAFIALTLIYWKDSPTGMVALMAMCGGDGLAEVVGKQYGKHPLPWSKRKSWEGLAAMFAGGWLLAVLILWTYLATGVFQGSLLTYLPKIFIIFLAATAVESLPFEDVDNITIPVVAAVLGHLIF